ncbi:MAG: type 2 isopentenyl-diphosphate Delta-isomerase [Gammaproteobacteria bacterium]|nr:type 2 isopentenyl-diphosphate Delta-isomerase [Gammaproteobacteria bacterium]
MNEILQRKIDHIDLVLAQQQDVKPVNAFDAIELEHNALPEQNLADIELTTEFLQHQLKLPFLISSMTGGPRRAETINLHLAEAAQQLGIAMGVGSQRVALESPAHSGLNRRLRQYAPGVPLFSNIGAAQLQQDFGLAEIQQAIDMIEADGLIIHFNPLQEALQENGDTDWGNILSRLEQIAARLSVPVIAKEVGMGISVSVARKLIDAGVQAIDVAGRGGTSFSRVEGQRARDPQLQDLGEIFADWGISTPRAIMAIRSEFPELALIASGGIRHGLDAAKAMALGANLVGQAGPVLQAAMQSTQAVVAHFETMARALRIARFCSGRIIVHGQTL